MSSLGSGAGTWRSLKTIDEFCQFFGLSENIKKQLEGLSPPNQSTVSCILDLMQDFFQTLKPRIANQSSLDLRYLDRDGTEDRDDKLLNIYVACMQLTGRAMFSERSAESCLAVLNIHVPRKTKEGQECGEQERNYTLLQNAFHRPEAGPRNVAKPVYDQIVEYYRQYDDSIYGSPYTSIVGPSGIGKSFVMQSIARQGLSYVIYVSLAGPSSTAYPRRSLLADSMTRHGPVYTSDKARAGITTFFECYIAASMVHVQLCKKYQIHPLDFFNLQVCQEYQSYYQTEIKGAIEELVIFVRNAYNDSQSLGNLEEPEGERSNKRRKQVFHDDQLSESPNLSKSDRRQVYRSDEQDSFDHNKYVDSHMAWYEGRIDKIFQLFAQRLSRDGPRHNKGKVQASDNKPSALFCFDEALSLLTPSDISFVSLRRALRHQSMPKGNSGVKTDGEKFFAVLLDTSAKVSTISPPKELDPSAKFGAYEKHFPLIWQINSFDVLARGPHTINPLRADIDVKRLFTLGRPNWGARLQTSDSIKGLINYATTKAFGGGSGASINDDILTALLSYRIQFYVVSHHLSENLVSGYLRMVYSISDDRRLMRTIHPSEPILAYVAAEQMRKKPNLSLQILQKFHSHCALGTIDVGDIGEIVAALIFLLSFDRKHAQQVGEDDRGVELYPSPVGLHSFPESLFGEEFVRTELGQYRDDNESIRKVMTKGFVFFNHFTRLEGAVNDSVLRQAWGRGVALFTYAGTAYFDIIIPVAVPDGNTMTYLIVQVKNRQDDQLGHGLLNEADYTISRAASRLPEVPACLGIFMALRCKKNPGIQVAHPQRQTKTRLRSFNKGTAYAWQKPTCLVIAAVGLNPSLYPGVEPAGIRQILRDLLDLQGGTGIQQASPYVKNMAVGYAESCPDD
ncbi:hypothetical protein V8E54_001332 [Elaphomyces granulatus]